MLSFPAPISFSSPLIEARRPFIPPKGFATGNVVRRGIMKRYRRTNVLAVFCALTSVFLILHGCGGGGGGGGGGPVAVTYGISGQATLTGSGLSGVTMALSGVSSGNAITDASGNYAFTGLDNGSYTITPSKTGFTFSPTSSSQTVSGANITGVNFIATPVAPAFSQADLTGPWDVILFFTGSNSGWVHLTANTDGSGGVTVTSLLNSNGDTTLPAPGSFTWTISAIGVVSESGVNGNPTFHGQMSSNKQLVIGTDSRDTGARKTLRVFRKRTGVAFNNADLANISFVTHSLFSGTDNTWEWSVGTTDSSRNVTLSSRTVPSGTSGPFPNVAVISVNTDGIVTDASDPSFYGFMTDDKKVFFSVNTADVGMYSFMVGQLTGQTYTQSDYAGTINFSTIRNTVPNPFWAYGVSSVDAAGNGTYLSYTDSAGNATPASFQRVLSSSGVVTDPADATAHGQMSFNKDITVRTHTNASGRYGLVIGFK